MVGPALAAGWLLAVGAEDGLVDRWVGERVTVGLLLEQFQLEGTAQVGGPLLALVEGDQVVVVGEHQVEGLAGSVEELLTQLLPGRTRGATHGWFSDL